jgi:cellulose biosynthesis protein BcsQ
MRYAIWNNKGGVGKSFLTFIFASEYAAENPDQTVYVIDMCPQANVSEIFLGGNGHGTKVLSKLLGESRNQRQTVGGYFDSRIVHPHEKTGNEANFSIHPCDFNPNIPNNLYLVAGDPSLEVQAEAINQIANQSLPVNTWRNVHSWLADLCSALQNSHPNSTFFIDCNPSFAAYTELSIVAADKLIVPCSADGSSARAIDNIAQLVYGHRVPQQYAGAMFSSRLKQEGLAPPSIGMVVLNRSTQYNQKASQAFGAMFAEIKRRTKALLKDEPMARGKQGDFFFDIPDTHSVAIVASHEGKPIRCIKVGKYKVFDQEPQVNGTPLQRYTEAVNAVVSNL